MIIPPLRRARFKRFRSLRTILLEPTSQSLFIFLNIHFCHSRVGCLTPCSSVTPRQSLFLTLFQLYASHFLKFPLYYSFLTNQVPLFTFLPFSSLCHAQDSHVMICSSIMQIHSIFTFLKTRLRRPGEGERETEPFYTNPHWERQGRLHIPGKDEVCVVREKRPLVH